MTTPEDAVRAMGRLAEALERNTTATILATREQARFNAIMLSISQKSGNAGMVKALLEGIARAGVRRMTGAG